LRAAQLDPSDPIPVEPANLVEKREKIALGDTAGQWFQVKQGHEEGEE
jgi:hypothetical protein